jgi:hypothetical protein
MDAVHLLAITFAPLFGAAFGTAVLISTGVLGALVALNVPWWESDDKIEPKTRL